MFRRRGLGQAMLAAVLSGTIILAGCSTDWVGQAEKIVAVMIPAATNLVTLVAALEGKTVSAEDLAVVQSTASQAGADLELIQSLIAAYEKADAAGKTGILTQIQNAMRATQANLQGLLPALHIKDTATQAKITAVVGILLSEVQSLAALVPLAQGQTPGLYAPQKRGEVGRAQVPLSANEFVKAYNSSIAAKSGNADVDRAAAGLKVHVHSAAARWASAGVLQ